MALLGQRSSTTGGVARRIGCNAQCFLRCTSCSAKEPRRTSCTSPVAGYGMPSRTQRRSTAILARGQLRLGGHLQPIAIFHGRQNQIGNRDHPPEARPSHLRGRAPPDYRAGVLPWLCHHDRTNIAQRAGDALRVQRTQAEASGKVRRGGQHRQEPGTRSGARQDFEVKRA